MNGYRIRQLALILSACGWLSTTAAQPTPPSPSPLRPAGNPEHDRLKRDAENAYKIGNFPLCIDLTGRVLAQNPRDDEALYLRASGRVELGLARRDVKEVRAGVEDAREAMRHGGTDKVNYYLPYFYGMTALSQLENRREHADVVVQFAGTLLSRPTLNPIEKANILYQRATAHTYLQNLDAAARDFEAALQSAPQHLGALQALAGVYVQLKRPDKAEAALTQAVQAAPDNPLVYNNRGMFFHEQGDLQKATADFTRAIEVNPHYAVAYTNRGYVSMLEGNPDAAETDFTTSLKIDPNQPPVYSLRGTSRLSRGDSEGAINDYQHVLRLDPKNPIAQADLGFARFFAGDYAAATAAFDKATAIDANLRYLDPWRFWSLMKSGQAQTAATQFAEKLGKPREQRDWVDMLLAFVAGKASADELLKAVDEKETPLREAQLAEAHFFIAEKKAAAGDAAGAAAEYQQVLKNSQKHLAAYRGAQYALKAFK